MSDKLSILYVTTSLRSPPYTGSMLRTVNIARQLKRYGTVTVLAVSRRFDADSIILCGNEFSRFEQVRLKTYGDYPAAWRKLIRKVHTYWPTNCGIRADRSGQAVFEKLAAQHDIVWFHTLGAAIPFTGRLARRSVMDLDDLNHFKYEQNALFQSSWPSRLSATIQSVKWKRQERSALETYNAVLVCSQEDKTLLGGGDRIKVVPNGFKMPSHKPEWKAADPLRLGFIGLLNYAPNRDGLIWFRNHVWPVIRREKPAMQLRIIGRTPSGHDAVRAEGFDYLDYIEDPTEEMQTWSAMIVPIPYGGGTRIKILDAFSKMCPVVSTAIGAYGIQARHNMHLLAADDAAEFARHCLRLSAEPQTGRQLAEEGWTLFTRCYTWDEIGRSIAEVVNALVRPRGQ